jgi:hypothetical protein
MQLVWHLNHAIGTVPYFYSFRHFKMNNLDVNLARN